MVKRRVEAYLTVREIRRARAYMMCAGASLAVLAGNRFATSGKTQCRSDKQ